MTTFIEPIFQLDDVLEYVYNRNKEDYIKQPPTNPQNLNNSGEIRYELNNQQYYISVAESFMLGEFKITKADGTDLGNGDITLENCWFWRLLNSVRHEVGGREVENIAQAVGEAVTMMNFVSTSDQHKRNNGLISGWCPDTNKCDNDVDNIDANVGYFQRKKFYNAKKTFTMMFPLKGVLGFTDYTKILSNIKIALILNRKADSVINPDIFYGATVAAPNALTAKITINKLEWWIPYIEPSLQVEELITKRLNTNAPINVNFMKNSMNEQTIPTGSSYSWKIGNYANSVRFLFIAFKRITASSYETNNALFTENDGNNNQITSIRVKVNNMYYPNDGMKFNFSIYNIVEAYLTYVNACRTFGFEPQMSLHEFVLNPIFCFDLSAQPEALKSNGIDITIQIEKTSALTLQGYCLVKEESYHQIDVADGKMLRIR